MKNISQVLAIVLLSTVFTSCATILSKSTYPLTVNTNPSGVQVLIKNNKGAEVYNGTSPATVKLKASSGYFKRASYTVHISGEGYADKTLPINFKIDGWYFGNLLVGGLIGMLIVDPASGAMYKIEDEYISVNLTESNTSSTRPVFNVYDIASIPAEWKDKLVQIRP